ncbi:MAG: hypothetical protein ACO3AF_03410, partial [Flavobacteriales bacterium]
MSIKVQLQEKVRGKGTQRVRKRKPSSCGLSCGSCLKRPVRLRGPGPGLQWQGSGWWRHKKATGR